jgi:hypothetical protein
MARTKLEMIAVYVPHDVKAAVEKIARDDQRTVAGVMRVLINRLLREQPQQKKGTRNAAAA